MYITVMQRPQYKQISIEDLLFGDNIESVIVKNNLSNTRTYNPNNLPDRLSAINSSLVENLIIKLNEFNNKYEHLREKERSSMYNSFFIPKKSGGKRRIDSPKNELMECLRELKNIFEYDFKALYHTNAYAYIKNRSTIDAVKKHQKNNSRWFGKYDLHDFFGSTTIEFVMSQFSMIYPFCEVMKTDEGNIALSKALDLAFLNGGLPQGTPVSPLITNVMMIPIDHELSVRFRKFEESHLVYTRYADDFIISSKYGFDFKQIESVIIDVLSSFNSPFSLNESKTRYGSSSGRNWNLGVMLNKDNNITIGRARKKRFESILNNYANDKIKGVNWDIEDVYVLAGNISYYRMVERDNIDAIIAYMSRKKGLDIESSIRADLKR